MCVLKNERYTTYQTGFSFKHLGHAPRVGLWGHWEKLISCKHGHVAYQIDGNDKQNRMQLNFHSRVKLMTLGEVKWSNIMKFQLLSQFQRCLYETVCVFSQIKDRKHIERNFHSVAWVMHQRWVLGVLGVKNFSLGICNGAPSTARSSNITACNCLSFAIFSKGVKILIPTMLT